MNEILTKAVAELSQEKPNIDYVRGMLETLLAMNGQPKGVVGATAVQVPSAPQMVGEVPLGDR